MIDVACKVRLRGRDDREYGLADKAPDLIVRSSRLPYDGTVTLDFSLVDGFMRSITVSGADLVLAIQNAINKGSP